MRWTVETLDALYKVCCPLRCIVLGLFLIHATAGVAAERPPNIVFILADDLGWSDTTPYGSTFYETPNIERLAARGTRFTQAYAASPLCSPTRASILTGQYPGRLRLTAPTGHLPQVVLDPTVPERASPNNHVTIPGTRTRLPNDYTTYAEVMKEAGYATAFMGKWHLGREPYLPEAQGFDVVVGGREHPGPPGGFFAPWPCDTLPEVPEGTHIDDAVTGEAVRFLEANRERPFLLNLWFYSVHAPFETKPELLEKYRAKAGRTPDDPQASPTMGGMIETLDDNIGRVLDALDRLGLTEKTLVLFTSDNGGNEYNYTEGVLATNNEPLRNGKGNIYEGGHRVPLIASWPGHIAEGATSEAIVTSVDYFPTILHVLGLEMPVNQACDGINIWPQMTGAPGDPARAVFCHFPHLPVATGSLPATTVRRGPWKLLRFYGDGPGQEDRLDLYNLQEDIGERANRAETEPELAATLNGLIEAHLADTASLVPKKNPDYVPSVLGWTGSKDVALSRQRGHMRLVSMGEDPWIVTDAFPPVRTNVTVEIRMRSTAPGAGAIYWSSRETPGFSRERRVRFDAQGDAQWHDYRVDMTVEGRVNRLRIDPAQGTGEIAIAEIRIIDWRSETAGKSARYWDFR